MIKKKVIKKKVRALPSGDPMPKTLGACADMFYDLRNQRLTVERQAAEIGRDEAALKDHIIRLLPKDDATGVRGKVAQASIDTKKKPTPEDWTKIRKFIKRTGDFDLLQRRLNDKAVESRWEAGEEIPGVGSFNVVTLSCTKLGAKKGSGK